MPISKLFDVRLGNGLVDGGATINQASIIEYKALADANKLFDAFATAYGYTSESNPAYNPALPVDPVTNPQTIAPTNAQKRAHFHKILTQYIREVYRSQLIQAATATAAASAGSTADNELPLAVAKG